MSQFVYKRIVKEKDKEEEIFHDSFNPDFVIRTLWYNDKLIVLLNDGHEESEYVTGPIKNSAGRIIKEAQKARVWKFTDIALDKEDAARFRKITEVGHSIQPEAYIGYQGEPNKITI